MLKQTVRPSLKRSLESACVGAISQEVAGGDLFIQKRAWPCSKQVVAIILGVDSSSILFSHPSFNNQPFPQGVWWFSRKKDPWKELKWMLFP